MGSCFSTELTTKSMAEQQAKSNEVVETESKEMEQVEGKTILMIVGDYVEDYEVFFVMTVGEWFDSQNRMIIPLSR